MEANRQFRLHRQKEVIYSSEFLALRDQLSRVGPIPRGRYILIPCTLEAEISQTYLVRVLAKLGAVVMRELLLDQPQKTFLSRKLPSLVTYVKIYGAKDLVKKTSFSSKSSLLITAIRRRVAMIIKAKVVPSPLSRQIKTYNNIHDKHEMFRNTY